MQAPKPKKQSNINLTLCNYLQNMHKTQTTSQKNPSSMANPNPSPSPGANTLYNFNKNKMIVHSQSTSSLANSNRTSNSYIQSRDNSRAKKSKQGDSNRGGYDSAHAGGLINVNGQGGGYKLGNRYQVNMHKYKKTQKYPKINTNQQNHKQNQQVQQTTEHGHNISITTTKSIHTSTNNRKNQNLINNNNDQNIEPAVMSVREFNSRSTFTHGDNSHRIIRDISTSINVHINKDSLWDLAQGGSNGKSNRQDNNQGSSRKAKLDKENKDLKEGRREVKSYRRIQPQKEKSRDKQKERENSKSVRSILKNLTIQPNNITNRCINLAKTLNPPNSNNMKTKPKITPSDNDNLSNKDSNKNESSRGKYNQYVERPHQSENLRHLHAEERTKHSGHKKLYTFCGENVNNNNSGTMINVKNNKIQPFCNTTSYNVNRKNQNQEEFQRNPSKSKSLSRSQSQNKQLTRNNSKSQPKSIAKSISRPNLNTNINTNTNLYQNGKKQLQKCASSSHINYKGQYKNVNSTIQVNRKIQTQVEKYKESTQTEPYIHPYQPQSNKVLSITPTPTLTPTHSPTRAPKTSNNHFYHYHNESKLDSLTPIHQRDDNSYIMHQGIGTPNGTKLDEHSQSIIVREDELKRFTHKFAREKIEFQESMHTLTEELKQLRHNNKSLQQDHTRMLQQLRYKQQQLLTTQSQLKQLTQQHIDQSHFIQMQNRELQKLKNQIQVMEEEINRRDSKLEQFQLYLEARDREIEEVCRGRDLIRGRLGDLQAREKERGTSNANRSISMTNGSNSHHTYSINTQLSSQSMPVVSKSHRQIPNTLQLLYQLQNVKQQCIRSKMREEEYVKTITMLKIDNEHMSNQLALEKELCRGLRDEIRDREAGCNQFGNNVELEVSASVPCKQSQIMISPLLTLQPSQPSQLQSQPQPSSRQSIYNQFCQLQGLMEAKPTQDENWHYLQIQQLRKKIQELANDNAMICSARDTLQRSLQVSSQMIVLLKQQNGQLKAQCSKIAQKYKLCRQDLEAKNNTSMNCIGSNLNFTDDMVPVKEVTKLIHVMMGQQLQLQQNMRQCKQKCKQSSRYLSNQTQASNIKVSKNTQSNKHSNKFSTNININSIVQSKNICINQISAQKMTMSMSMNVKSSLDYRAGYLEGCTSQIADEGVQIEEGEKDLQLHNQKLQRKYQEGYQSIKRKTANLYITSKSKSNSNSNLHSNQQAGSAQNHAQKYFTQQREEISAKNSQLQFNFLNQGSRIDMSGCNQECSRERDNSEISQSFNIIANSCFNYITNRSTQNNFGTKSNRCYTDNQFDDVYLNSYQNQCTPIENKKIDSFFH